MKLNIISDRNGSVSLGNTIVTPLTTLAAFESTDLGQKAKKAVDNGTWLTLQVCPNGKSNAFLVFKDGQLVEVRFALSEKTSETWNEWSSDKEAQVKQAHDDVLRSALGEPPYQFK